MSRRRVYLLVEDGNTAELSAVPFRLVLMELGTDRLKEWAHKGDLHGRSNDGTLEPDVLDYSDERALAPGTDSVNSMAVIFCASYCCTAADAQTSYQERYVL